MTRGVDQQILWLYVTVHDAVSMYVVKCSKKLIRVQLDEQRVDLLLQLLKVLLDAVDIRGNIIHHNVQLGLFALFFPISSLAFLLLDVDEVSMSQPYDVLMVHLFVDLKLTTFICFVLSNFFNSNVFARTFKSAHPNSGESANSTLDLFCEFISLLDIYQKVKTMAKGSGDLQEIHLAVAGGSRYKCDRGDLTLHQHMQLPMQPVSFFLPPPSYV